MAMNSGEVYRRLDFAQSTARVRVRHVETGDVFEVTSIEGVGLFEDAKEIILHVRDVETDPNVLALAQSLYKAMRLNDSLPWFGLAETAQKAWISRAERVIDTIVEETF